VYAEDIAGAAHQLCQAMIRGASDHDSCFS
jgi:hypothetical protein